MVLRVRVHGGSRKITTRNGGWRRWWKPGMEILKSCVIDVRVRLF